MRRLLLIVLVSACSRSGEVATKLTENANETARVSRETEDLRRRVAALEQAGGGGSAPAGTKGRDRSISAEALAEGVAAYVGGKAALPAAEAAKLVGVWRATDEVLQVAEGGGLCGWRREGGERRPFWGTWRTRGALLVELRDRWVGDHNEVDAVVRDVTAQAEAGFTLSPGNKSFSRVAPGEWEALSSIYEDRITRFPGLPEWCLRK